MKWIGMYSCADNVIILPSDSFKKVLANSVRLFCGIVCRCIYLINAANVLVVSHQNSVHVTPGVWAVVVHLNFIRQAICMGWVKVSNGVVAVLRFVSDVWEQTIFVEKLMKAVLPQRGVTPRHLVVVQAVLDVPHQQLQTVARRRLAKAALLQLPLWIECLQSCGHSERKHQCEAEKVRLSDELHVTLVWWTVGKATNKQFEGGF